MNVIVFHSIAEVDHFDSVRGKTRPSVLSYARKNGLKHEMNEMVPPIGIEPTHPV